MTPDVAHRNDVVKLQIPLNALPQLTQKRVLICILLVRNAELLEYGNFLTRYPSADQIVHCCGKLATNLRDQYLQRRAGRVGLTIRHPA